MTLFKYFINPNKISFSEGYKNGDFDFLAKIPHWVGSAGIKQRITREKRWKPETAIILNTYYNFSSPSHFKLANFVWESQFLFQSTINS